MSDAPHISYAYPSMLGAPKDPYSRVCEFQPTDAFYAAWKATPRNARYVGRETSQQRYVDKFEQNYIVEQNLLPLPVIYIEQGKNGPEITFVEGAHRFTNQAMLGIESIPVIARSSDWDALKDVPWIAALSEENRVTLDGSQRRRRDIALT